jgi:hypothetical protein
MSRSTAADVDSARLCPIIAPIVAFDERVELLALVLAAAHRMGVDAQPEGRVGVAELLHHVGRGLADRDQDRSISTGAASGRGSRQVPRSTSRRTTASSRSVIWLVQPSSGRPSLITQRLP